MEILIVLAKLKKADVPQMNFSLMKIKRQVTCPSHRQRHIEDPRLRLESHPHAGSQIHAVQVIIIYIIHGPPYIHESKQEGIQSGQISVLQRPDRILGG